MSLNFNPFRTQLQQVLQLLVLSQPLNSIGLQALWPEETTTNPLPTFNPIQLPQSDFANSLIGLLLLEQLLESVNTPQTKTNLSKVDNSSPANTTAVKPAPKKKALILIEGDSMSDVGFAGAKSYPKKLEAKLGNKVDFSFRARSGEQVSKQMLAEASTNAKLFDGDRKDNIVVLWGGTNDIYFGETANTAFDGLKKTAQTYKDEGFKVLVLTAAQNGYGANRDHTRKTFNDLIRNAQQPPWDEIVDIAKMPEFSDENDAVSNNRKYYADTVHLTETGNQLVSNEVEKAIQKLIDI